ncbi:MAG TPA: muramoyltetrapeptide carboxypeptidase [Oleiagrimonas sp.]|nr:muramoyltetrapeptide carboxypeptidase [Oleiagrimonas sp.]
MSDTPHLHLIAPSGWPAREAVARGAQRLRESGWQVTGEDAAARRHQRFAGTDAERAGDINALADPAQSLPDVVMAVRGGYGMHRLLEHLDYAGLRERLSGSHCVIVGHSDFTALSLALLAKARVVTFAGPMLAYDFGGQTTSQFTVDAFDRAIHASARVVRWQGSAMSARVNVTGRLWGGNLATLCSLLGTPYVPGIERGILFLEDVFEPMYRVERMLYQLKLSGVLDRQNAIVLGDFSGYRADEYDRGYDLAALVRHLRTLTDAPVVTHLPFGHCRDKLTLPVGGRAHLRVAEDGKVELAFTGYPYLEARPQAARVGESG